MRWTLGFLLVVTSTTCAARATDPSWPEPVAQLVVHPDLSVEDKVGTRLTIRKKTLKARAINGLKKVPHPTMDQMNKFNTVTGFAMQVVQIIVSLKTGGKSVKLF